MKQELSKVQHALPDLSDMPEGQLPPVRETKASPVETTHAMFDFGLVLVAYLFWLVALTNVLLLFGVTISDLNCVIAVPFAWGTLFALRRKSFVHTLLVTAGAMVFVFAAAYIMSLIYDESWDSVWYHKLDTGLLAHGWNPFTQSMGDFAYSSGLITTKTEWQVFFDGYPKATYTIGACFYALFGTIEAGKCFNIIGMMALICIGTPLIRRLSKLKFWQSLLITMLLAINPVSLIKSTSYYNDGFLFSLLTLFALSLYFLYRNENARLSPSCRVLLFMAVGIGLNVKFSALIYFGIFGAMFYIFWLVSDINRYGRAAAMPRIRRITLLLFLAVLCALTVTGATTYIVNLLRYGNPLYSVIGEDAISLADQEMPVFLSEYSPFMRFIISIFSKATNDIYLTTTDYLKIPFTIASDEWSAAKALDLRSSGWGLFFSGVFILSCITVIGGMITIFRSGNKQRHFSILLLILLFLFIPPAFVPGLWWARYNIQLFWLPAIALTMLFLVLSPASQIQLKLHKAWIVLTALIITAAMLFNLTPACLYISGQAESSAYTDYKLESLKTIDPVYDLQISFYNDSFYGALFTMIDEDLDYTIVSDEIYEAYYDDARFTFMIFSYLGCEALVSYTDKPTTLDEYLQYLAELPEDVTVLIAACDDASNELTDETVAAIQSLGLEFDLQDKYRYGYIGIVESAEVVFEEAGLQELIYSYESNGHEYYLLSSGYEAGQEAYIFIDNVQYALNYRGLNIVIYDAAADEVLDIVAIDTCVGNGLSR